MAKYTLIVITGILVVVIGAILIREPSREAMTSVVPVAAAVPAILLHEPVPLHAVEHAIEGLPIWRASATQKPTLLLLSNAFQLQAPPAELSAKVDSLAANGTREELGLQGNPQASDPLLLPTMALDIALRAGWFGRVFWALPLRNQEQTLSPDGLRRQLLEEGLLDAAEADSLRLEGNVIRGQVRGLPLVAATLSNLPEVAGPVVVHIDQSYFQQLYKNEVATPVFPIIYDTLAGLRNRRLPVYAVTFDQGNLDGRIALDVRFTAEFIRPLLEHPETFEQPAPELWKRQADVLYLANFFQKERVAEINLTMEKEAPQAAWVKYNLFHSAAEHKDGSAALNYLAEAVRRDRIYALEYLDLAQIAYDKKRPDEALRMLGLAADALPEMAQIRIQKAQLASELGERDQALTMVEELRKLPWSKHYYAGIPSYLEGFEHFLTTNGSAPPPLPRHGSGAGNP